MYVNLLLLVNYYNVYYIMSIKYNRFELEYDLSLLYKILLISYNKKIKDLNHSNQNFSYYYSYNILLAKFS